MPVDPFSIAGVFGLAAGLIGFTVSTIEKSAGQLNTARQAHQRLRGHWEALKTCQQRLEAWERQWYDHEKLEQDDLNFLWDREGVQAVDSKRAVLLDEQGELLKLLYNGEVSESRSRETSSWWSKVFRDLDMAMRSGVPGPDPPSDGKLKDFSIRVAMALWRNNNLSASVGRLRGLVEDLERTSVLCFHKAQRSTGQITQPSQEEVEGLIQQRRRMRHLIEALLSVYHGVRRQSDPCELLLTSFDELEICQLRTHHELTVSFLLSAFQVRTHVSIPCRRIVTSCHLDSANNDDLHDQVRKISESRSQVENTTVVDAMRDEFLFVAGLPGEAHDIHLEDIKFDCTTMAVQIAAWSMLTWGSQWLDGLSSCKIAQAQFADQQSRLPVFIPSLCSKPSQGCSCTSDVVGRPYLLLAILLAELALACPISVVPKNGKMCFHLHGRLEPISKSRLLEEVKAMTSWHYYSALKYCLSQDTASRSKIDTATYNHVHFYKKVIEPLDKHYRPLRNYIESHPEIYDTIKEKAGRRGSVPLCD